LCFETARDLIAVVFIAPGKENSVKKILEIIDKAVEWIIFVCAVGFVVLCFVQVLCRYVLNNSLSWSEEASRFLFVFVVFLGGIICVKEQRHTFIDILVNLIPDKPKKYYMVFVYLLMLAFSVLLIISGWGLAVKNIYQVSSAMRIPIGYIYMVIPLSGLFMGIHSVLLIVHNFTSGGQDKGESNG
jgi:C4-dicarboxylate transporter DctQ subunit